jgi:hypothetical protein
VTILSIGRLAKPRIAAIAILGLAMIWPASDGVDASCNLIPGARLSFDSGVNGTATRPFAGPGEHVDIDLGITAAAYIPTDYRVSVYFKPSTGAASHLVVLTDVAGAGCAGLCSLPPASSGFSDSCLIDLIVPPVVAASRCVELDATGLNARTINGDMFLSFMFPDVADLGLFGTILAGPAQLAVTKAGVPLPDLATVDCAAAVGLDVCVDEITGDDTFRWFVALPAPNSFANECIDEAPPCLAIPSVINLAFDDLGNAFIPWDWSNILVRHEGRPVPRLVTAELKLPFAIPNNDYLSAYAPEGGVLAPIFEPQFDPTAPTGTIQLFGSADAPYTILRIARGGMGITSIGSAACMEPIYDPAVTFPGSTSGLVPLPNDGIASCPGTSPRVCLLESGIPVSLRPVAQTDQLRAHLVDEEVDGKLRNADSDALDETILLQDRTTGVFEDLGTAVECGALPPGAEGRASTMVNEPAFIDILNPPPTPHAFAGVAAEDDILASLESEMAESCDINGNAGATDNVLRVYQLSGGSVANELTIPSECSTVGTAAMAAMPAAVIDRKAVAVSGGLVYFRGYGSGMTGSGSLNMWALDPIACSFDDLGPTASASVSDGNAAMLHLPGIGSDYPITLYRSGPLTSTTLGRHASTVSMSGRWLAALVSESVAVVDDNGDADMTDQVARVYDTDLTSPGFNVITRAASSVQAKGDYVVMTTSEAGEGGTDLNSDGDALDFILEAYKADCPSSPYSACRVNTIPLATDLYEIGERDTGSCGLLHLVAFTVSETEHGPSDLNSDGDSLDNVLYVLDLLTGTTKSTGRSAVPCTFAECDPRVAWSIEGSTVTYLTDEADEGLDLDYDGSTDDIVVTVYDFCRDAKQSTRSISTSFQGDTCTSSTPRSTVTVSGISDSRPKSQQGQSVVIVTDAGRCVTGNSCALSTSCGTGAYCDRGKCCPTTGTCLNFPAITCAGDNDCEVCALRAPGTCRTNVCGGNADCPAGTSCQTTTIAAVVDSKDIGEDPAAYDIPPTCIGETMNCGTGIPDDSRCAESLAKSFSKVAHTAATLSAKCHKRRNRKPGLEGLDCNRAADYDDNGKLTRVLSKLQSMADKHCDNTNLTGNNVQCPSPCSGATGSGAELANSDDLASCLGCVAQQFVEDRHDEILGRPNTPMANSMDQKCHATIAKEYTKHMKTLLKNRDRCVDPSTSCSATVTDPKVIKAADRASERLDRFCGPVNDLASLDSCAASVAGLANCLPTFSDPCGPSPWCLKACGATVVSTTTTTTLCTTTTTLPERIIFATSIAVQGDTGGLSVGGLSGADNVCDAAAATAALPGSYIAWMCDGITAPIDRMAQFPGPYIRTDGALIANDFGDLTDGTLINPINYDEFGNNLSTDPITNAWTFANADALCDTTTYPSPGSGPCPPLTNCLANCSATPLIAGNGWTSQDIDAQGVFGDINASTNQWSSIGTNVCADTARLYCVQQ